MANRIKGITVEIGGDTTGLTKALSGTNKEIRSTQTQLKDVERLLKLDPTNTELLKEKQRLLADAVSETRTKLDALKEAEKQVQEQFKRGEVSQEQYDGLQREIIQTEQELKNLEKQADNSSIAITKIANTAVTVAEKTKGLSLAAAGLGGALIGNAYSAAQMADEINTLSKQTGLGTDEIQKFKYASEIIDVPLETLTGSMAKLTRNMESAKNGSKNTQAAFDALGVSIVDQNGQLRDNQTVFLEAIDALGRMENETQRDALAMQIFGKSAQDLNPLILGGADALEELSQEAEDAGLILSQDALDSANEFNDAIDELKAKGSAGFMKMGAALAEALLPHLERLMDIVGGIVNWFANLDGGAQTLILTILGLVAAISPIAKLIQGITVVQKALNLVMSANPIFLIITAVAALVAAFIYLWNNCEEFREFWINLWNGIKDFFIKAWEGIKTFFTETIPNMFNDLVNWFAELPGRIWEWLVNVVTSIIQWIVNMNNTVNEGISNFISGIVAFFQELPGKIWDWLVNVVTNIIKWIVEMNQKANEGIANFVTGIINKIKELPGKIWEWLMNVIRNIAKWITDMNRKANEGIRNFVDTIVNKVKELPGKFLEWGKDMIQNFIDGIKSMFGKVGDAVSGIADTIASFLHFSVPDKGPLVDQPKWMPDMIDNMIQGINQNKHKLVEAMNGMALDMSGTVTANPASLPTMGGNNTTNTTNNAFGGLTVNVYSNGDLSETANRIAEEIQQATMRKGMVFA